jgi:nanoRNase/pAp phosphatase (c-di-AMP/oligoRNAs hydrolase)
MSHSKFEDLKTLLTNKKILITSHDSADIDSYASCVVFNYFLKKCWNTCPFLFFSEISSSTKEFINKFTQNFPNIDLPLKNEIPSLDSEICLFIDTNNLDQINFPDNFTLIKSEIPFLFIDHHYNLNKDYKNNLKRFNIIDENYSSTAEIIYQLCEYFSLKLPISYRYLIIAAILTDTGFFKYANKNTFKRMAKLLGDEIAYQNILPLLVRDESMPERLAKIKSLQRLTITRIKHWLIGVTHVGSYEAIVATLLINIGFDVGIVYSEKKNSFRISTRAKKQICLEHNLHLGKIMEEISEDYGGSGGGHDGAASFNGTIQLPEILNSLIAKIKQILN